MDKTLRRKLLVNNPLLEYRFPARWVTEGLRFPLLARYQPPVVVMFDSPEIATRDRLQDIKRIIESGKPIAEIMEELRCFENYNVYAGQIFMLERPAFPWEHTGFRGMDLDVSLDEIRAKFKPPCVVQVTYDLPAIPILPLTQWEPDSIHARTGAEGETDRQIDYEGGTISAEQYSKITEKTEPVELTPLQVRQYADEQSECRV